MFAEVWNAVIAAMRESDIISYAERDMLQFQHFYRLPPYQVIYSSSTATSGAASTVYSVESDVKVDMKLYSCFKIAKRFRVAVACVCTRIPVSANACKIVIIVFLLILSL